ncbi:MAG TPA: hypothetical protein VKF59_06395 [Candidatus Dormibacteraeota bacterium]|nr:hypothetical protein [Candidatus Dormibacteraeota bacterium]
MRRVALIWGGATAIVAAIVGFLSYQAGWAAGLATRVPVAPAGPGPYYGYYGPHFWGFGLVPLLFVLLVVWFVFRATRWRRGWGPGGWGPGGWGPGGWYGQYPGAAQQQPPPGGAQPPPAGDPLHDWPQRPRGDEPGAGRPQA